MSRADGPLLVVGIGNVLLRDEGVGVHVVRALHGIAAEHPELIPLGTSIVDGGTLGLDLLPLIDDARAVLLVDAVNLRSAPGAIRVIDGPDLHATLAGHVSPHQVGVGDLIATARLLRTIPDVISLVAIQGESIEIGLELTPKVAAALPTAVDTALAELQRLDALAPVAGAVQERSVATAALG